MTSRAFACVAAIMALTASARPQEPALSAPMALFELALDIDNDGKMDRAVLVSEIGTNSTGGRFSAEKDRFMLGRDERADLYIYLGTGDEPLDLSRKPDFIKQAVATRERNNQIYPLEKNDKGSLVVKTAFNLFSNWMPETLTIVHRDGEFIVAGLIYSYERKDGAQGGCDINFLTGSGVVTKGLDGKPKPVREKLAPVKLADWSEKKYPKACR
ncbi:MAG: hypothetical protein ACXWJ0_06830 [Xanthobacteraceae bacterium]